MARPVPRRCDPSLARNALFAAAAFCALTGASAGTLMLSGPASYTAADSELARASAAVLAKGEALPKAAERTFAAIWPSEFDARADATPAAKSAFAGLSVVAKTIREAPATVLAKAEISAETLRDPSSQAASAAKPAAKVVAQRIASAVPARRWTPAAEPAKDAEEIYLARELFDAALSTGSLGRLERDSTTDIAEATKQPASYALAYAAPDPQIAAKPDALAPVKLPAAKPRRLSAYEKLYGKPVRLASLGPIDFMRPDFDGRLPAAPYDLKTAVYVITEAKVYLPDGSVHEAHSGLGDKMDKPRYAHVRMHGVTPPHVYRMKMREALFHGVEAIRLLPLKGEAAIHGRDGLLAHTYMLGPSGQSNGCISFKNYAPFLKAFKEGRIDRVAVIEKID